jgi:hypothetical protein
VSVCAEILYTAGQKIARKTLQLLYAGRLFWYNSRNTVWRNYNENA